MADMIQIRRDTAANWTSANPILAQGELGAETDTSKIKIGDGTTAWSSLDYLIDTGGYVTASSANTFTTNQVISASTSDAALRVTQTGAGNALLVEDSSNPDSSPFVVNNNGQVSTGFTSNPATMFGSVPQLGVHTTGNDGIANYRAGADVNGAAFIFQKTRGSDPSVNTVVASGDNLGVIYWSGADGTGYVRGAQIASQVDGTPGTNDMPGRLVFSTTSDGASNPTERMRIDSAGRVGIGGTPAAEDTFIIGRNSTGATTTRGIAFNQTILSDVTSSFRGIQTGFNTQGASFTLSNLVHVYASQGTFNSPSVVTNQYGFSAESTLTSATNNYGFYSNIASGTGRWNFYANGTARNYFGGSVGIGIAPSSIAAKTIILGADQTTANINPALDTGLEVASTGTVAGSGGSIVFSAANGSWKFAAIKGFATNGSGNSIGSLAFSTRNATGDSTLTERMRITATGETLVGTTTNTNSSVLVSGGTISETVSGTQYLIASQYDVGSAPNEIPLNQYLGTMAYRDNALVAVPASATAVGSVGDIAADSSYIYVCVAQNTWVRAALSTW